MNGKCFKHGFCSDSATTGVSRQGLTRCAVPARVMSDEANRRMNVERGTWKDEEAGAVRVTGGSRIAGGSNND